MRNRSVLSVFVTTLSLTFIFLFKQVNAQDPASGDNTMQFNRSSNPTNISSIFLSSGANLGVDLYTGKLQASLPIYTLESSDLKIPISIGYTAGGGVKPQDINTPVGLGWTLNAGGSISRTVRGLPDEAPYGYIGTNNTGLNVVSDFNNPGNGMALSFNNTYNAEVSSTPNVDGEPDIFYLQTPFFNLRFTIDQNGQVVTSGNTGYKINHSLYKNSSNASNTGFVVTDDSGNQYYFGSSLASKEFTITKFFGQSFTFVSTWYLDKIVTYNSKDLVTLSYMQGPNDTIYNYLFSKNYTSTFSSFTNFPPTTQPVSFSGLSSRTGLISTTVFSQPKYISQIITKLGEADFSYTYNSNKYINTSNPPELTSVVIKQFNPIANANTTIIKTFSLYFSEIEEGITGYTQPYPYNGIWSDYYRRLLTNITVTGNTSATSSPLTLFNLKYNQDQVYPNREMIQNCDYWGYINSIAFSPDGGTNGGSDINYFTTPDNTRQPATYVNAQNKTIPTGALLSLVEIDNFAGESALINYELNTYYNGSANQNIGGSRVMNITHTLATGEQLFTNYSYNDQNGHSTGQINNDFYKKTILYFGSSCCNFNTLALSQSPYNFADDRGVFVGYSMVKVQSQRGGSEVDNFTNFSDYPDVVSAPSFFATSSYSTTWGGAYIGSIISSFSYKRGLLKSQVIYNSSQNPISETDYTYSSLDAQPAAKEIGIQDMTWWLSQGATFGTSTGMAGVNIYNSNFENWRLTQTIQKEYDQNTAGNFLQTTTTFTYCPNKRLIQNTAVTDSKGATVTKTFYHADDTGVPMLTTSDQTAITAMLAANKSNVLIHELDVRGNAKTEVHNSYLVSSINGNNGSSDVYLASSTPYSTNISAGVTTQGRQQLYNYDILALNLISSNISGGKSTALGYGYNLAYVTSKTDNASSTTSFTSQQTVGNATISAAAMPGSTSFTVGYSGSITINLNFGGSHGSSDVTFVSCTLSGPTSSNPVLCYSSTGTGCGAYGTTVTIQNVLPGNYTLNASVSSNTYAANLPYISCTYPLLNATKTFTNEFFYEGFEANNSATVGTAHSGIMYMNSNYTVPYVPPSGRNYIIQWWNLSSGAWVFNEQAYTANQVLTGPVDDIRIFPSDALMTTYTYSPLLGKTSETDPSGKTISYQYDGLGRLQTIRDQDNNILKQYDYQYQVLTAPVYNDIQQGTFQKTNCPTGYSGLGITYTVPANTYSSFISKADANQKAINDVAANGPNYANAQSTASACVVSSVTITCKNNVGATGYTITFKNTSTNVSYVLHLPTTQGTLVMPPGTYNVTVTTSNTGGIIGTFCTTTAHTTTTGTTLTMNGLTVSSTGCLIFQVDSYQ